MPEEIRAIWAEGAEFLIDNEAECARIDEWRDWKPGTAQALAESGFLGLPLSASGDRGVAFLVQAPSLSGKIEIGFHFREPRDSNWYFHPNSRRHGVSISPLPFVIGSGCLDSARLLIICEGQWDACMIPSQLGWLSDGDSWPSGIVVFGILGANCWRYLIERYRWSRNAAVLLIPDNDPAGKTWSGDFMDVLRSRSRVVTKVRLTENDLTDEVRFKGLNALHLDSILKGALSNEL